MSLIDIGANLTNKRFKTDLAEVILRAKNNKVAHIVVTGTCYNSSVDALTLVEQYPEFLSSTAGMHPHDASHWNDDVAKRIHDLLDKKEVVAVGECGLDFNRNFSPRDQQEYCFEAQLEIAAEVNKPLFLHERDAHDRFIEILKLHRDKVGRIVVHCFTGDTVQLHRYLDLDCYIGVTGWVCDERRGDALRAALPHIPDNRLMIETDAPYLMPRTIKPKPKSNRNEPSYLKLVLQEVAQLRNVNEDTLALQTTQNAERFFGV